jgi:hypothetical protein
MATVSKTHPVDLGSPPASPTQEAEMLFPPLSSPTGRILPVMRRRLSRLTTDTSRRANKYDRISDCSEPVEHRARRVDRVYRNLSKHEPPHDETTSVVLQDLIIDTSAGWRAFGDLYPNQAPLICDPIAQGVGLTTSLCAAEGALTLTDTWKRLKFAYSIGNTQQAALEGVNLAKDGMLLMIGAAYAAYRPLNIAAFWRGEAVGPHAPTALGQAAYNVVAVGNGLLGALYTASMATSGYKLYHSISLRHGLTADKLTEALRDPSIDEVEGEDEELVEMVKTRAAAWIDQMLDKMDKHQLLDERPELTEDMRKEIAWNMLNDNLQQVERELRTDWPDIADELLELHDNDPILALGHALKIDAEKMQRTMNLNNSLGADLVKTLRAKGNITDADVAKAKEALNHNIGWQVAGLLLAIGGILWVVFSYISDPISNWLYAIQSALCALVDAKGVKDWLSNLHAGSGDMRMALISLATAVVSIVLVALLFTHFGLPVWMLIVALTMDTFWVASNIAAIYKMSNPNLEKPNMDDFARFIETCNDDSQALEVFSRLDVEARGRIEKEISRYYREHHIKPKAGFTAADFRRAIRAVSSKALAQEKRELEILKAQLLPCIEAVI